jgi:hypothetical protein
MIKKILACVIGLTLSTSAVADDHAVSMSNSDDWTTRKGLRFGYNYVSGGERSDRIISPHMFAIGFESQQTMSGGDWLDLLFVQNVTISGLEQSLVIPSANVLVGFEINDSLQLAVGANATIYDPADDNNYVHLVSAIGWTQAAGHFSVPVHLIYIPDVNEYWRLAVTTGVNW